MLGLDRLPLPPLPAAPPIPSTSTEDSFWYAVDSQSDGDISFKLMSMIGFVFILFLIVSGLLYCERKWKDCTNPSRLVEDRNLASGDVNMAQQSSANPNRASAGDIEMGQPSSGPHWPYPYQSQRVLAVAAETVIYHRSADARRIGSGECVICLGSFEEGEECLVLENCNHAYHKNCIEEWLSRDRHCPLCRDSVRVRRRLGPLPQASVTSTQSRTIPI